MSFTAQVSHPHSRILTMYWMKTWCLNLSSTNGLWKKCRSLPISLLAFVILLLMSKSSVRSNEIYVPRYLKWAVKSMYEAPSDRWMRFVLSEAKYMSCLCFCVILEKVRFLLVGAVLIA